LGTDCKQILIHTPDTLGLTVQRKLRADAVPSSLAHAGCLFGVVHDTQQGLRQASGIASVGQPAVFARDPKVFEGTGA
jgi:hypothetical protein